MLSFKRLDLTFKKRLAN